MQTDRYEYTLNNSQWTQNLHHATIETTYEEDEGSKILGNQSANKSDGSQEDSGQEIPLFDVQALMTEHQNVLAKSASENMISSSKLQHLFPQRTTEAVLNLLGDFQDDRTS